MSSSWSKLMNGSKSEIAQETGNWPIPLPTPDNTWTLKSLKSGTIPSILRSHVDWRFKDGERPQDPSSKEGWINPVIEDQCGHTCCSISGCLLFPWMRCAQLGTTWQRTSLLACLDYGMSNRNLALNQWDYNQDGTPWSMTRMARPFHLVQLVVLKLMIRQEPVRRNGDVDTTTT